jgi:hypothetical protein
MDLIELINYKVHKVVKNYGLCDENHNQTQCVGYLMSYLDMLYNRNEPYTPIHQHYNTITPCEAHPSYYVDIIWDYYNRVNVLNTDNIHTDYPSHEVYQRWFGSYIALKASLNVNKSLGHSIGYLNARSLIRTTLGYFFPVEPDVTYEGNRDDLITDLSNIKGTASDMVLIDESYTFFTTQYVNRLNKINSILNSTEKNNVRKFL